MRLNADLRSDSAAAWRCPWQQQVPPHHPPAASVSLSHATPPPMHTSNATSDPAATGNIRGDEAPPALIITTRLSSYTFLPCASERTAAATVEPRVGRGNGLLARRCCVPARSWRVQGCPCGVFCRLRGAAIARRRRLCRSLSHQRHGHSVCAVPSASTPATVTPSALVSKASTVEF